MMTPRCCLFGALAAASLVPQLAWGQTSSTLPPTASGPTVGTVPAANAPPPQPGSTYVVAPAARGAVSAGPIGGGNASESSAHPVVGDEEDSFDFGTRSRGGAAHGDENGPVFVGAPLTVTGEVPSSHVVRRGDTLWALCDAYYKNPYEWPRVWSYNPQIKNPHWIYPGDEVRLRQNGADNGAASAKAGSSVLGGTPSGASLVDRRRQVANDTVFLRDQGWIRDPSDQVWGEITGSSEDKMYLSDFDEVYLHVDSGHDVRLGQDLTIFRPLRTSAAGTIVQIQGTVRIDQWNAQDRVARAQIVETLNVIERGAKVGPLSRSFAVVPTRRNESDVQAHVLASVHPNEFWGQNQVVFIDRGEASGLKLGNRLFIIRQGDAWRRSLVTPGAGNRVSPDDEKPMPPMETTPSSRHDEPNYPDEVVGELRVVALKKDTGTCVVTQSKLEIEPHDLAVARRGY
ncbi:MAG: LysM peptidoglycan-binding domain-containing protein [Myxococcota bacterium]|nr:LysM peptidoglycan-binding domain-containing protein [Myxococcota bacterium]